MFILTTIEDLIQIAPQDFDKPSARAIKDSINVKYANRVIHKIGLCVCVWDILKSSEGLIGHGTGLVNVNVEFRMVVMRPFRGEILYGRIKSSNHDGIVIDLEFTYEVWIPVKNLFENTSWDEGEQTFIWKPSPGSEFYFDKGETVLFRVESEDWFDQKPEIEEEDDDGELKRLIPWKIIGSMNSSGLGPTMWWEPEEGETVEEEQEVDGNGDQIMGGAQ